MSNKRCCCWSSSRRSISARCSWRGGGWPSAGTRTSRRPAASTSTSATSRRSTRPPTSSSSSPSPRAAAGSPATRSRSRPPRPARPARRRAAAPTRPSSARARRPRSGPSTTRSAPAFPTTRSSTATRAASPIPSGASGTVTGIYFSGEGDDVQQWARVSFAVGVRTIPAGSLQFVDFSKPDPAADRVQRFMTAAQHALAEGDAALAAQRLIYARDAEPTNPVVLRLLTAAFWQAGNLPAAARTVRDWARVETDRPTPERFASRIYEDMGAIDLAADARCARRRPRSRRRLGLGAARAPAAAADGSRRRDLRARAGAADRAHASRGCSTSRSPTTSPATSAPRSRRRRRATRLDPRLGGGLVDLRPRAGADRPRQRVHRRLPSARSSSATTRRSRTCSSGCEAAAAARLAARTAA